MRRARSSALLACALLPHFASAQCPRTCAKACAPPECGSKCCKYYENAAKFDGNARLAARIHASRAKLRASERARAPRNITSYWDNACPKPPLPPLRTCAPLWASRPLRAEATPVVMMGIFKQVRRDDMVRFLEYHFVLGVTRAVLFDNNCETSGDYSATDALLAPYVAAGRVSLRTEHRCARMSMFMFKSGYRGGSAMARQLSGMRGVPRGALVIGLDDDEYMVLRNTSLDLGDVAGEMERRRVCAVTLLWRVFGQSAHRCQPHGPLLSAFTSRLPQKVELVATEVAQINEEAIINNLNPPFIGKPLYLYLSQTSPVCATHFCEACPGGYMSCAQEAGPDAACRARLDGLLAPSEAWVNHYAFQSQEHWERKKRRGRTNQLPTRLGGVPPSYDRVPDGAAMQLLAERLRRIEPPPLRACLEDLFEGAALVGRAPPLDGQTLGRNRRGVGRGARRGARHGRVGFVDDAN